MNNLVGWLNNNPSVPFLVIVVFVLFGCDDSADVLSDALSKGHGPKMPTDYVTDEYIRKHESCKEIPDQPRPEKADVTPSMHEYNRPAEWQSQRKYLGETCYQAAIGPVAYQDEANETPDYYSIDVEVRRTRVDSNGKKSEAWSVIFRREFSIEELPMGFVEKRIADVVSFDSNTNTVIFGMGNETFKYDLPLP